MDTFTATVKYLGSDDKLSVPILEINWDTVTYIDTSWEKITNLIWMKPCPNLQYLRIEYNKLSSLSGLPQELPNLQYLNLQGNDLSSLDGLPEELPNLTCLNMSCTNLRSLSGLPEELPNLQELDISDNKLSSLFGLPQYLPNLQKLYISSNNLRSLDGLPQELPNLKKIYSWHTNLSSLSGLPEELPNLQHLDISGNNLISLEGLPQKLPNLQELYLHVNNLSSLKGLSKELPNLQDLIIAVNNLSSLEGLPTELPNLQDLDISSNNLSSLSGLPQELPNLQKLYISKNTQITTLPNFLINYRNLQELEYDGLELELEPRMRRWLNRLQNHNIVTTTQVYGNSQNVHDSSIQETVRQSMRRLLDQDNMPKQCLDTLRNQIVQDSVLSPKSKGQLLEYIQSEEELHELCLTYADLLWAVWHTLSGYTEDIQVEIKRILNQELQDSDCKCFTGRMTRLVNCLNGFCDLVEVKILDSAQIGNIILLIKQRLEASDGGYSVEKHREEFREEMLSRGENAEVIIEWLEYIE